jgi:type II secretory pathway pseudopilin PulG
VKCTDERGFTLVEAVVAMMVCTVGLVALAELMAVTLRLQQLGRNSTSAVRIAQDKLDDLTTKGFQSGDPEIDCGGSLTEDEDNHNEIVVDDNNTPDDATDDVNLGYRVRWVIANGPDGDLNLRQVTIRVLPDNADRRTASPFDMTTFLRSGMPALAACP